MKIIYIIKTLKLTPVLTDAKETYFFKVVCLKLTFKYIVAHNFIFHLLVQMLLKI